MSTARSASEILADIAAAQSKGTSPILIKVEKDRKSKDGSVSYYDIKWMTADGKEQKLMIKLNDLRVCKVLPKENREGKSPKAQLTLSKSWQDNAVSKEGYEVLRKIDTLMRNTIKDLISAGKLVEDKVHTNGQFTTSRKSKNPNVKLDDPIFRYEFKFGQRLDYLNTKFFNKKKFKLDPKTRSISFEIEPVTDDNIHTFITSGSRADTVFVWDSINVSNFGISAKGGVSRIVVDTAAESAEMVMQLTEEEYEEYVKRGSSQDIYAPSEDADSGSSDTLVSNDDISSFMNSDE